MAEWPLNSIVTVFLRFQGFKTIMQFFDFAESDRQVSKCPFVLSDFFHVQGSRKTLQTSTSILANEGTSILALF